MARMKQRGSGFFFTLEDIARFERAELPFMLQTAPGFFLPPPAGRTM